MRIKDKREYWADHGEAACRLAGYDADCVEDNAQDTIVAILHFVDSVGCDFYDVLERAQAAFEYEINPLHQEEEA